MMKEKHESRTKLGEIEGERSRFSATFERTGTKQGGAHYEVTVLLVDITHIDSGKPVTDHLWLAWNQGFNSLRPLTAGDVLEFDARVVEYAKGRKRDNNRRTDWKVSHPTKWERVKASTEAADATEVRRQSRPDANKAKKKRKTTSSKKRKRPKKKR